MFKVQISTADPFHVFRDSIERFHRPVGKTAFMQDPIMIDVMDHDEGIEDLFLVSLQCIRGFTKESEVAVKVEECAEICILEMKEEYVLRHVFFAVRKKNW